MIDADGCLLNVSVEGRDGGPTIMLSNSLGATMQMWEPQMAALTKLYRVVRYDRRGHGKSGVPAAPYAMERFGKDVLAISTISISRKCTGAGCPWAAWSASGLAPTPPNASRNSSSPTRLAIIQTLPTG
jgi:pimeloyl-ACP methyl ester carboxylesterase